MKSQKSPILLRSSIKISLLFWLCLWGFGTLAVRANTITTFTISGPAHIACGTRATYTFTLSGLVDASGGLHLDGEVWDDDFPFGREDLTHIQDFLTPEGTIGDPWTYTGNFELFCNDPECLIRGDHGSSGERKAEVFMTITDLGQPLHNERPSNTLIVDCVPVVPLPDSGSTLALLGLGFAGLVGAQRTLGLRQRV